MDFKLLVSVVGGRMGDFSATVIEFETSFLADAAAEKISKAENGLKYHVVKLY